MLVLFKVAGVTLLAFVLLAWITGEISRKAPRLRNPFAFCLASGAAYSLSFALDMFVGAVAKIYSFSPLALPVFTWAGIAFAVHYLSRIAARSKWAIRLPYFLLGGLVLILGFGAGHFRHFYVGIPLIVIGLVARSSPISAANPVLGEGSSSAHSVPVPK